LLDELWYPDDGDRSDRKAGRAWLRSVCRRLEGQLARGASVPDSVFEGLVVVDETTGTVALDPDRAVSDVQAFVDTARRSATASGPEQIAGAEEALELGVRQLCPSDLPERVTDRVGRSVPIFAWLQQLEWEQDAPAELRRLWRDTALRLARAYRDAGRHAAARDVYAELLEASPLQTNAQEGLLLAMAEAGDLGGLEAAWERVRGAWDKDPPDDLRELYEGLRREVAAAHRPGR
jgi:tetratricopeptide (TPR) repeat protein